jgi:hypothetical protein
VEWGVGYKQHVQRFNASTFQCFNVSTFQRFNVSSFQRFNVSAFSTFQCFDVSLKTTFSTFQRFHVFNVSTFSTLRDPNLPSLHHDGGTKTYPGPAKPDAVCYRRIIENPPLANAVGGIKFLSPSVTMPHENICMRIVRNPGSS